MKGVNLKIKFFLYKCNLFEKSYVIKEDLRYLMYLNFKNKLSKQHQLPQMETFYIYMLLLIMEECIKLVNIYKYFLINFYIKIMKGTG